MKILALVAGTNTPSNTDYLADTFIKGIREADGTATVEKIMIRDLHLDHFTLAHYDAATAQGPDFARLKDAVLSADGLLVASPIWNFSVPAHLKNLIDRIGSFGLDTETHSLGTLKGKPVFLLYAGGSPTVAWTGLISRNVSHMPYSLRYFGATIVGMHYEERCTLGRGVFGLAVDKRPKTIELMRTKGGHFGTVVGTFAKTGELPFREKMLRDLFQFGQKVKIKLGL
jgi:NAD(P)H-dependent FMN reductase